MFLDPNFLDLIQVTFQTEAFGTTTLEGCTASFKKMNLCSAVNLKYFQSPFVSLSICVEVVRVCV